MRPLKEYDKLARRRKALHAKKSRQRLSPAEKTELDSIDSFFAAALGPTEGLHEDTVRAFAYVRKLQGK